MFTYYLQCRSLEHNIFTPESVLVLVAAQIMFQVFSGQKPPLDREGMPKDYEQLIEDCWDDAPESRPTFAAILQRLRLMYSRERQRLFSIEQANTPADAPAVS